MKILTMNANKKFTPKKNLRKTVFIGIIAFLLVFSATSIIFTKSLYDKNFPRYEEAAYSGYLHFSDVTNYDRTVVKFKSGQNTLTGYVYGEENQKGLVVIAPGRGEGEDKYLPQALYFVDHGWRVFTFDYTGSYASEGASSVGLPQSLLDLESALVYVEDSASLKGLPLVLFGHSWGGYAVTAVLGNREGISAVASISGFNSPMGLMTEEVQREIGVLAFVEYPFEWLYQSLLFGKNAWVTAVNGINHTDIPVMIIHGSADDSIFYNGASIIAQQKNITNPNVVYKTSATPNHNGHKSLFQSQAAVEYIAEKNRQYKDLSDRYAGNVPESVRAGFYAGVDPFRTSELDIDFMNAINDFFENSVVER